MAMSDCEKCWETPCACGHDYKGWPLTRLKSFRDMIDGVIREKESARVDVKEIMKNPAERERLLKGAVDAIIRIGRDDTHVTPAVIVKGRGEQGKG